MSHRNTHYRLKQAREVCKHIWFMIKQIPFIIRLIWHYSIAKTQFPGVTCFRNIRYHKEPDKHLNLYLPSTGDNFKLLIYVHGGGWNSGKKELYHFLGTTLCKDMNIAVAVVGYTLHPTGDIMDMIRDVSSAIEWAFTSTSEYSINTQQIHLFGHSAGAHILTMALLNRIPQIRDLINSHDMSHRNKDYSWTLENIKSFTAATGVYDIVQHYEKETMRAVETLSGMAPSMHYHSNFERFSPLYLVRKAMQDDTVAKILRDTFPPMLLVDAENDTTVMSDKQTSVFLACMKEELRHEKVQYQMLSGFSHADPVMCFTHQHVEKSQVMLECLLSMMQDL